MENKAEKVCLTGSYVQYFRDYDMDKGDIHSSYREAYKYEFGQKKKRSTDSHYVVSSLVFIEEETIQFRVLY